MLTEFKWSLQDAVTPLSESEAIDLVKTCFASATERDIYTVSHLYAVFLAICFWIQTLWLLGLRFIKRQKISNFLSLFVPRPSKIYFFADSSKYLPHTCWQDRGVGSITDLVNLPWLLWSHSMIEKYRLIGICFWY